MLESIVQDYVTYMKLDTNQFQTVQDVVDNMLTRLEELTSVLQLIKSKNNECMSTVLDDIIKYRTEITVLSKKINTINEIIEQLQINMEKLEQQVEKAEEDFGIHQDNRLKHFLRPFLKKSNAATTKQSIQEQQGSIKFTSVMDNFDINKNS